MVPIRQNPKGQTISLPLPQLDSSVSLEEAISKRRSKRNFKNDRLTLQQVSQILWAAQGITDQKNNLRTAPSAGALYPLDLYLVVGEEKVTGLTAGVYHYLSQIHELERILEKDLRDSLMKASLFQVYVKKAPIILIITVEYERTTQKYGKRGVQYAHMEAGHVGQNVALQVTSLDLGTVTVGAFEPEKIKKILNLPTNYQPLYVMPIGQTE
ncbi:MAG: SagB/ThcOx family dehydrogenase [Candidatus Pacebacteria bacterium]|nr:SagB/ThcOx family dehydrogenase [Candidatus Paceibacterota bacterium]